MCLFKSNVQILFQTFIVGVLRETSTANTHVVSFAQDFQPAEVSSIVRHKTGRRFQLANQMICVCCPVACNPIRCLKRSRFSSSSIGVTPRTRWPILVRISRIFVLMMSLPLIFVFDAKLGAWGRAGRKLIHCHAQIAAHIWTVRVTCRLQLGSSMVMIVLLIFEG